MDGYLAKPVRADELIQTVEDGSDSPIVADRVSAAGALDGLVDSLGGDRQLAREMMAVFLADAPRLLADVHDAVEANDAERLRRAAHACKGAAGLFDRKVARLAAELEGLGLSGTLSAAVPLVQLFESEWQTMIGGLQADSLPAVQIRVAQP